MGCLGEFPGNPLQVSWLPLALYIHMYNNLYIYFSSLLYVG